MLFRSHSPLVVEAEPANGVPCVTAPLLPEDARAVEALLALGANVLNVEGGRLRRLAHPLAEEEPEGDGGAAGGACWWRAGELVGAEHQRKQLEAGVVLPLLLRSLPRSRRIPDDLRRDIMQRFAGGDRASTCLLLHGPPGCGKTSAARAAALAAGVPLIVAPVRTHAREPLCRSIDRSIGAQRAEGLLLRG